MKEAEINDDENAIKNQPGALTKPDGILFKHGKLILHNISGILSTARGVIVSKVASKT